MKLSDLIRVVPQSRMHGSKFYLAFVEGADHISCRGKTRELATSGLVTAMQALFQNEFKRRYFFSPSGRTCFALYYRFGGWNYDIIREGMNHPSTCGMRAGITLEEATEMVKKHAANYQEPVE